MNAIVAGYSGPREVTLIEEPVECARDQVLVRLEAFAPSVGTTLKKYYKGEGGTVGGTAAGTVIDAGETATDYSPGDRVVVWTRAATLVAVNTTGDFIMGPGITRWLDGVSAAHASLMQPYRIALAAVRRARLVLGDTVLVIGQGAIGNLIGQMAKLAGAEQVIVSDVVPMKLETALSCGADHALNPQQEDVSERVLSLTDGRGADIVFEVSGTPDALQAAIDSAAKAARIVVVSWVTEPIRSLDLGGSFHFKKLELVSTWHATHPGDYNHVERWTPDASYQYVQRLLRDGRLQGEPLISCRLPFAEAGRAMAMLAAGDQAITVVLDFPQDSGGSRR